MRCTTSSSQLVDSGATILVTIPMVLDAVSEGVTGTAVGTIAVIGEGDEATKSA
jgi:hypothetical protein